MADKNLSVEEIIEQYSHKVPKKSSVGDFDVDEFLKSFSAPASKVPQKTEMIEDVLEIGDNSLVVTPQEFAEKSMESAAEYVSAETAATEKPEKPAEEAALKPKKSIPAPMIKPINKRSRGEEQPVIREGSASLQGTQAMEKLLASQPLPAANEKKKDKKAAPAPVRPAGEPPMRGVKAGESDDEIAEKLRKLKSERGGRRPVTAKDVPPVSRASINDIDLDLGKKVIPITEMGLDKDATEEERLAYLDAKQRERVKQYVSEEEEEAPAPDDGVEDFTSFDQAHEMGQKIKGDKSRLIARLCILLVTGIISAYLTVATDNGVAIIPALAQSGTYLLINVILGLIACLVSVKILKVGIVKLFKMQADSDSLAAVSVIFTLVSAIAMLSNSEVIERNVAQIYISAAIAGLAINTIGKLIVVTRTERNFRYISGGYSKYAAIRIFDEEIAGKFTKGALTDFPYLATSRKTEFVNDFIRNSYSPDATDGFSRFYVPIVAGISVLVGIIAFFTLPGEALTIDKKLFSALAAAAGTMSMVSAMGMMLVTNIPLAIASKKYLQSSAVMLGYSAVDDFADTNSVLIDAVDLFPDGMVEIVNLKPARKFPIEEGIIYAASLCCQTESILKPAFYKMIRGKTDMLYAVESYICEDGLGISGWIENKRVLFGSRTLMESHSIEGLPTPEKEKEYAHGDGIVYLSIGGSIAMIFIVRTKASVSITNALKELERQKVTVILRSVDSLLNITRLNQLFGVSPNCFKLLPFRYHAEYDSQTSYVDRVSSPMIFSGRFESLAMLITGAKRIQRSANVGIAVQGLSAVLAIILAIIFAAVGSFGNVFTGTVVLVYGLVWAIVTAVIQLFSKT